MLDTTSLCLSCCFLIKTYFHKKDSDKDLSLLFVTHWKTNGNNFLTFIYCSVWQISFINYSLFICVILIYTKRICIIYIINRSSEEVQWQSAKKSVSLEIQKVWPKSILVFRWFFVKNSWYSYGAVGKRRKNAKCWFNKYACKDIWSITAGFNRSRYQQL